MEKEHRTQHGYYRTSDSFYEEEVSFPEGTRTLFLYAQPKVILPAWFSGERLGLSLVVTRTSLFPGNSREGFSEWKEREFFIRIS